MRTPAGSRPARAQAASTRSRIFFRRLATDIPSIFKKRFLQQFHGQADHITPRAEGRCYQFTTQALNGVAAGFVERLTTGNILRNLRFRERMKLDLGRVGALPAFSGASFEQS